MLYCWLEKVSRPVLFWEFWKDIQRKGVIAVIAKCYVQKAHLEGLLNGVEVMVYIDQCKNIACKISRLYSYSDGWSFFAERAITRKWTKNDNVELNGNFLGKINMCRLFYGFFLSKRFAFFAFASSCIGAYLYRKFRASLIFGRHDDVN